MNLYISPGQYISGYDNILEIGKYIKKFGKNILFLTDEKMINFLKEKITIINKENEFDIKYELFNGECCYDEIERLKNILIDQNIDAIAGFGGGKIMDTAKAASYFANKPVICIPTIAATCAAWASHSAIYTIDGISYEYLNIGKNAELVFVDKKIIIEAPIRYIISGILDTLAKWIETDAYTNNIKNRNVELEIAIFLAKKSYEEIIMYSTKALEDIKNKEYTKEVDMVIEHIFLTAGLIGGIGGAACRAVAAHAVNNGFTVLTKRYKNMLHGEVVSFGNIVQLVLDNKDEKEIKKLIKFYNDIGAPKGLKGIGCEDISDEELERVINKSLYKEDTMWNLPYKVDFEMIKNAIKKADEYFKLNLEGK